VRVLFTSTAGDGHVLPILPLAQAFAVRGDDVLVAAAASHSERIERLGLRFVQTGPTMGELAAALQEHRAGLARPAAMHDRPAAFTGRFALIEAPRRMEDLRRVVATARPDVLIHESADLAAPIAGLAAEIPTINHAFGLPIPEPALRRAGEAMAAFWRAAGLEPDELAGAYRGSYVGICPPSFRAELPSSPSRVYALRPAEARSALGRLERDRPLVYATLGTTFNAAETFRTLLDAFDAIDCDVLMTIGRDREPADLEPIPANVRIERYVPQAEILPNCDAVVAHAGSGSVLAALAHGLPLVLVPQGADQFANADACMAAGVAEAIDPSELTVGRLRETLQRVIGDAAYGAAARSVAAEIAAMPSAASVADEIAAHR